MLDLFLAKFYKVVILVLLVLLALAVGYGQWKALALDHCEANTENAINKALKPYIEAEEAARKQADNVSGEYEKTKATESTKTQVINNRIEKITERIIYRNVCLDADGVSELNEAGHIEYPP